MQQTLFHTHEPAPRLTPSLYCGEPVINSYASATFPPPRLFQVTAHESLRQGVRDGHRCQVLMSATGSGKTYLALQVAQESLKKGRRVLFIADRTVLIDQTSRVADQYGMHEHGIIQADHWRTDYSKNFQIGSAQTIARRQLPQFDVIIVDECFTPDVEVLTEKGFIRFDELPRDIKCAQYHNGIVTFVEPTDYIEKPYNGEMVRVSGDCSCDLSMTPGHELLIYTTAGIVKKQAVSQSKFNQRNSLATAGYAVGTDTELSPIERLAIAYQADGSLHTRLVNGNSTLAFSFAKQRKWERLIEIVESCGLKWNEVKCEKNKRRFLVFDAPVRSKVISDYFTVSNFSKEKAAAVIREMVEWDGHKHSDTCWYYSSVIEENTDFYQFVCVLAGYRANKTVQGDNRKESYRDVHRLFIQLTTRFIGTQNLKKETFNYDGKVYCIRVPSGNIIVRRNGKPLVIGNCHCQYKGWKDLMKSQPEAHFIGLSATPFSKGLGLLFGNLVNAANMHDLTESGVLVPMRIMSCHKVDMTGAETRGGEWTDKAASERALKIKGDVVTDWLQHGYPRKTVVFGPTIADCEAFRDQFIEQGIKAAVFCADTSVSEREEHLKSFREPDGVMVLLSVEALAKGFDAPEVSCICDVRPLRKSLSTAIQMWGRGLRSCSGKEDCVLLDFSGNIVRFADDFSDIFYNGLDKLDAGEKLDKTIRRDDEEEKKDPKCPKCGFTPCGKKCIQCGHERRKLATAECEPGEMKEIFIGKNKMADDKRHLYEQLCTYCREMNHKEGWAAHKFKEIVGVFPKWNFHDMPDVPVTRNTKNKLKSLRLAWIKAKERDGR